MGLGCAGGTAGLARALEFCLAYPKSAILVLCIELCSLTFQRGDKSKRNLVGTSLFADGAACVLVAGEDWPLRKMVKRAAYPRIVGADTTLMPNSEDVMGWNVKDNGLHVVFAQSIPSIVETWLRPTIEAFLERHHLNSKDLDYFIVHPGGRKVLEAYQRSLKIKDDKMQYAKQVLQNFGNMSSPTVLFVLNQVMEEADAPGDKGLTVSLGPGFNAECVLLQWESVS